MLLQNHQKLATGNAWVYHILSNMNYIFTANKEAPAYLVKLVM